MPQVLLMHEGTLFATEQPRPQPPQFNTSLVVSTHAPPQHAPVPHW
jgi:hypothetical protein